MITGRASAWRPLLIALLLVGPTCCSGYAHAQARIPVIIRDAAARALIDQLALERAAALASARFSAGQREAGLLMQLADQSRQIRAALRATGLSLAETTRLQAALATANEQSQALIFQLSSSDAQYRVDLLEYRSQVRSLANSPDPRRRAALQRYADGDRVGAVAVLVAIARADSRAVAAGWREIGALVLDMRDRGEKATGDAIYIWRQATRLAPDYAVGWIQLGRLYKDTHRYGEARAAAGRAASTSRDDWQRGLAFELLASVEMEVGDFPSARRASEQALALRSAVAQETMDPIAVANAGQSADQLGQILLVGLHDASAARVHFEEALDKYRTLTANFVGSASFATALAVVLEHLGDAMFEMRDAPAAGARYDESLHIWEGLHATDVANLQYQRGRARLLQRLGDLASATNDLDEARRRFEAALEIERQILAATPPEPLAERGVSVLVSRLALIIYSAGDEAGARRFFEEDLAIARRMFQAVPDNAEARRGLWLSLSYMTRYRGNEGNWAEMIELLEAADRRSLLLESDRELLRLARQHVASNPQRH